MRTPLKSIAKAALSRQLSILFILLIGAIGVQTITSCSGGDDGGGGEEAIVIHTQVAYDASGGISGTTTNKAKLEYDSRGNQTKTVAYNTDGNISSIVEFEYDNSGNRTRQVAYDASGNVTMKWELEYDSRGNQTKAVVYNADGNISSIGEEEYDSNGNPTKQILYDANGNIIQRTEYNCNGSYCTYNTYNRTGDISSYGEIRYATINSKKLTASQIINYPSGSSKIEYEYDSRGNTTKQTQYSLQDGTGSYVKTYEITSTYTYKRI